MRIRWNCARNHPDDRFTDSTDRLQASPYPVRFTPSPNSGPPPIFPDLHPLKSASLIATPTLTDGLGKICRSQVEMSALPRSTSCRKARGNSPEQACHSPHPSESPASRSGAVKAADIMRRKGSLDGWSRCNTMHQEGNGRLRAKADRTFLLGGIGHYHLAATGDSDEYECQGGSPSEYRSYCRVKLGSR